MRTAVPDHADGRRLAAFPPRTAACGNVLPNLRVRVLMKSLLDASRARLIALLREGGMTADDLASKLDVSTNAVREHLAGMERDGVIRRAGQRRRATRPAQIFELTPETEQFLSVAYVPLAVHLVRVVAATLPVERVNRLMREAGKRLAADVAPRTRPRQLAARVALASQLLNEHLGAVTRVERNGNYTIRGAACPIAAVTGQYPMVCLAIESFVAEVVDRPVQEQCERAGRARCCFQIS